MTIHFHGFSWLSTSKSIDFESKNVSKRKTMKKQKSCFWYLIDLSSKRMFPGMLFGVWDPSNMILFVIAHRQAPVLCPDSAFGVLMPNARNQRFSRHFWSIGNQVCHTYRPQFWLQDNFHWFLAPQQHSLWNCRSRLFFRFFLDFLAWYFCKINDFSCHQEPKNVSKSIFDGTESKKNQKK